MGPVNAGNYEYRPESLIALRQELGLKQAKMAELIGVPANTLSRWETGATKPDAESLAAIYSVAVERGAKPDFFQRRKPVVKQAVRPSRLLVVWDLDTLKNRLATAKALDAKIRAEVDARFRQSPERLFKAYGGFLQDATMERVSGLGWRDGGVEKEISHWLVNESKSFCCEAPRDTRFVLITNNSTYADLLRDMQERGVLVHLFTTAEWGVQPLVDVVGEQRWIQIDSYALFLFALANPTQLLK